MVFRVFFSLILITIFGIYVTVKDDVKENTAIIDQNSVNENTMETSDKIKELTDNESRPEQGVSKWIGKTSNQLLDEYGEPDRIDPSAYGYNWWIYNDTLSKYIQFGVNEKDKKIVTLYSSAEDINLYPFFIDQTVESLYKELNMNSYIELNWKGTEYRFELSEEDLHYRPLIKFGDMYAQVYLDKILGQVSGVRFMDAKTLIMHKPYELTYRGELDEPEELTDEEWKLVEEGSQQQILDLTNIIRTRFDLGTLEFDEKISAVAFKHSEDMMVNEYFDHVSPDDKDVGDRLKEGGVSYYSAGENIAAQYTDAIAAVEGWLNSKGHRDIMLNEDFTRLGVGVYKRYYTQNFVALSD
ncbi:hypothetical protein F7984_06225 [Pradoshia sp. D12]|uniref:CAP domain-containing protein n=1 Tax=Bacillaceae TaxID=186817 RepID=UPI000A9F1300|nr:MULTISPECIES: CAP domain-containing protein [Bacillaceae]QFK70868.1 hypothetical protein F7984_06225 [Pradoshia sp. D12]TPF72660.1 hypothetical protein FHY44_02610 [Bacillus sp. D12]